MLLLLHPLPLDGSVWSAAFGDVDHVAPTLYEFGDRIEDWAAGALDAAGTGPLDLVGNSVGGSCALEVAVLAPERVRSIVLVGSKAGVRPEPALRDEAVRLLEDHGVDAAWDRYWAPLFWLGHDAAERTGRAIAHRVGAEAIARGVRAFHNRPDRHDFARHLDIPVLRISGELDVNLARATADVTLPRCGHYAPLEAPEELARLVREFRKNLD